MVDLISRQDALECVSYDVEYTILRLKNLPSAEPERKKGEWIDDGDPLTFKCDKCGYLVARYNNTNFCPNCGADMRGEQDETD